jgi:rare lipoprotein A
MLKVTNLANDSEVIVKVTDRGPFSRGRIIDLSWRAAKELGILAQGVAMVKVEVYREANGIPYKGSDNIELPELDFEITEAGYSYIDEWREQNQAADLSGKMKQENKNTATRKPAQKTRPATAKPDKAEKPKAKAPAKKSEKEGNKWKNVFDKLKNWSGDIFK